MIARPFREHLAIGACFASIFMLGVAISLLGPSLPALAAATGVTLPQAGVLFTCFAAGSVLATLLVARLNDRPERHAVLIGGALLMGLALWLVATAHTLLQAAMAIALCGLAMSTVGTAPNAIIVDLYKGRSGQALNALHIAAGIGAFVGPLMVGAAVRLGGDYRVAYRIGAVILLTVSLLWSFSRPPQPHPTLRHAATRGAWVASLLPVLMLAMLYTGTETTLGGWLFTYAQRAVAQTATTASLTTSLFWLAILIGRLSAVRVLRRISNVGLLRICIAVGLAGLALILLGSRWQPVFWTGVGLVGLGFGPVFPTALALSGELVPGKAGAASSLVVASGSTGAMVLPWSAGALMPHIGVIGSMSTAFLPLALMLACLWAIARRPAPQ